VDSVRDWAQRCLGLSGEFSVIRDFFGFRRAVLPADPTGAEVRISLRRQIQRLSEFSFNLNVITVGREQFTDAEHMQIDYAIFKLRNIYEQVGLGIARVQHFGIDTADARGLDTPTTTGDLEQLTHDWTVRNQSIDMFMPHNMSVPSDGGMILGMSPEPGPCNKDAKGMNGSTCGLFGSEQTARSFAHELGHYLGLDHRNSDHDDLMCQSSLANSIRNSVQLTPGQGQTMQRHCFVNFHCLQVT
jgi:hypothetical protein